MPWTSMSSSGTSIMFVSSMKREKKSTPSLKAPEEGPAHCTHPHPHSNHHHSDHHHNNHRHSNQVSTWSQDCTKLSSSHHDNQRCGHAQKTPEAAAKTLISRRTNFFHIGITAGSRAVANVRSRQVRIVSPNQQISIITPKRQIRIVSPSSIDSVTSRSKEESEVQRTVVIQPRQSVRIVKQNCQAAEESGTRNGGVSYRFVRKASNVTRFAKETRQCGGGSVVMRYPWGKVNITRTGGQTRNIVLNDNRTDDPSVVTCTNNHDETADVGRETESQRTVERLEEGRGGNVVNSDGSVQRRRAGRTQGGPRFVSVMYFQTSSCKHRGRKVKHGS
ncbi:uncharacterized protein LOC144859963 isoform X1 [Branchiostoma floridae x Branchiostoma japonicum]